MVKNTIIKVIILALIITSLFPIIGNSEVNAKCHKLTNKEITVNWCHKHYKGYKIKFVNFGKVPKHRVSNRIIYVEQLNTISKGGKKGRVIGKKWFVRYPIKVKKGKKRIVYLVYNPRDNTFDDVVCMVACHRIK